MTAVALGLGSNKNFSNLCPKEILGGAIFELSQILHAVKFSSVYRTKAMYVFDQEDFYNMVLVGFLDDGISAHDLLKKIHEIEAAFGRDRENEIRFGPRPLDIDIEFFGKRKIFGRDLQIPHPRLKERAFVLIPLLEVLDSIENTKPVNQDAISSLIEGQIISANATEGTSDAQVAEATSSITYSNVTTGTVDTQTAQAVGSIISTNATAQCADNINGKIFCLGRYEISSALSSLGESGGVEKIIRAQDFLPFIKSRLQNGASSR